MLGIPDFFAAGPPVPFPSSALGHTHHMTSVVVCGVAGWAPVAGMGLHHLQYCLGFRDLGLEVFYLEDNRWPPVPPGPVMASDDDPYGAGYSGRWLSALFDAHELPWAYADPEGNYQGSTVAEVEDRCRRADLLVNVSGGHFPEAHHRRARRLLYLDTEPGFVHVRAANGDEHHRQLLDAHHLHFTWAEAVGTPACRLPDTGHRWRPTRQPVHLPLWRDVPDQPGDRYTTVMNWGSAEKVVHWHGERWGQKDAEFPLVADLPRRTGLPLELAVNAPDHVADDLRDAGWSVVDPWPVSSDVSRLRRYIARSRGELTVVKQAYVRSRSGWFPERSANYLAAGRPVVCQDTGWMASSGLGDGPGLFGFATTEQAVDALAAVERDLLAHAGAARRIAAEHFDARAVLGRLLADAGID